MTEGERQAALQASRDMRDRAARAVRAAGVVPFHWLTNQIAQTIEALPLLEGYAAEPEAEEGES
jgi:hypothetical protein